MIIEILTTFFTTLGMIWFFLIMIKILNSPKENNQTVKINDQEFDREVVVYAEAEYVEQGSFKGWLIFEKEHRGFMAQGQTKDECREELKKRFPGKTILLSGWSEN